MTDYADTTSRQLDERAPGIWPVLEPTRQPPTARHERTMTPRHNDVVGEVTLVPETDIGRYGSEYGPYAGVRINCPTCGRPIDWTLEEDVTSDFPVPVGFCGACRVYIGDRA